MGTFTGHTRVLTVSKKGLVVERLDNGTSPVIQLTYQLSGTKITGGKTNGTTTASSLLTAVKVYDRKAISGNLPKVGDTGTMRCARASSRRPTSRRPTATARPQRTASAAPDRAARPASRLTPRQPTHVVAGPAHSPAAIAV